MQRLHSINSDPSKQPVFNIDVGNTRQGVAIEVRPIAKKPISKEERDANLMEAIRNLNDPELGENEWTANGDDEESKRFPKLNSAAMDLSPINPSVKEETPRPLAKKLSSKSYQRLGSIMVDNFLVPTVNK